VKFILKLLSRIGILQYFNYTSTISLNNKTLKIPIIKGLGLCNLNQKHTWFTELIKQLYKHYPNHEFLDIGANVGQTLIQVQSAAPQWKYNGFEPNENCVFYLNILIKANDLTQSKIFPYAVSDTTEKINLFLNSNSDTTATTIDAFRPHVYDNGMMQEIKAINFDEFYEKELSKESSFIVKIDIEGAEYLALQGMSNFLKEKRPIILCEVLDTHSKATLDNHKLHLTHIESAMNELNYNIYQIIRSDDDQNIRAFQRIEKFEIKIWSIESIQLNDYLFIPEENHLNLKTLLL
jgi:FkbM family methyltransferase